MECVGMGSDVGGMGDVLGYAETALVVEPLFALY